MMNLIHLKRRLTREAMSTCTKCKHVACSTSIV